MKLRNKKTGEIRELPDGFFCGDSLKKICEVWEDYVEPKEYWYIENNGDIDKETYDGDEYEEKMIEIGNYFETKEEAELAVRKLKAWKRLKDKGFRFNRWTIPEEPKTPHIKLVIEAEMDVPDSPYDLDLLFGGEE